MACKSQLTTSRARRFLGLRFGGLLAATAALTVGAQEPPKEPVSTDLVETVEVRVLQTNFLAVDSRGEPVTDLQADEIKVRDGGDLQKVAFLDRYVGTPATPSGESVPPALEQEQAGTRDIADASRPTQGRWLVLFFDNYLSDQMTRLRSVDAAREFIQERVTDADIVQLVVFDGKLQVLQPFTHDRRLMLGAVDSAAARVDHVAGDRYGELEDLTDSLETCRTRGIAWSCATDRASIYEDSRWREADALMKAVTHVVRSIKPIPSVKAMVLFSNGFSRIPGSDALAAVRMVLGERVAQMTHLRDSHGMDEMFDVLAAEAAEARVSIFPINPGGGRPLQATSAVRKGSYNETLFDATQPDLFRWSDQNFQASLEDLARRTGGRATRSNDILGSLNKAFDATSGLYTVGYYPSTPDAGSGKVKIKILRRGVKAILPRDLPPPQRRAPLDGELTLSGEACDATGRRLVTLNMRLALASLRFEPINRKEISNNFSLYIRFTDANTGAVLEEDFRSFNVTYVEDDFDGSQPDPTLEQRVMAPCRPLLVEIIAADAQSGARQEFSQRLPI